jgi:hypothetical protein
MATNRRFEMNIVGKFAVHKTDHDGREVEYETSELIVNGKRIDPSPYQDAPHFCTEFQWGYGGAGPAFTAYVLLLLATGDAAIAEQYHQKFKWQVVAAWEFGKPFEAEFDIDGWIALQERQVTR